MSTVPSRTESEAPATFTPPVDSVNYDLLVTEDDKPVDNTYSERQHRLLTDALAASWKGPGAGMPRWVATDVGMFASPEEPPWAPDVFVSLGVSPPAGKMRDRKNRSYFYWLTKKFPEMIVEVVSNIEGGELTSKRADYARLGIKYYVVWDPECWISDTELYTFALHKGRFVPGDPWFPILELGVTTWEGQYDDTVGRWLRWCDRAGTILPTGVERAQAAEQHAKSETKRAQSAERRATSEKKRTEAEKQRADTEKRRGDTEKQRGDTEKQRADTLADKLRSLGIDPDQT